MVHSDKIELLKESLVEMIHVAEYSINYRKKDKNIWGTNAGGGGLGFPSSVLLFSVIDCIGSVFSRNNDFKIIIEGKARVINNTSQHIYILNSKYFNLDLSQIDLENIYTNIRGALTHNSIMPEGYSLQIGENENLPFNIAINELGKRIYFVNLIPLLNLTRKAVELLIADFDSKMVDFENSKTHQDVTKRDKSSPIYFNSKKPEQYQIVIKEWIKK